MLSTEDIVSYPTRSHHTGLCAICTIVFALVLAARTTLTPRSHSRPWRAHSDGGLSQGAGTGTPPHELLPVVKCYGLVGPLGLSDAVRAAHHVRCPARHDCCPQGGRRQRVLSEGGTRLETSGDPVFRSEKGSHDAGDVGVVEPTVWAGPSLTAI
jgi:hypothetical protein